MYERTPLVNFFHQVDQAFSRVGGASLIQSNPRSAWEALFYIASAAVENGASSDGFLRLSEAVAQKSSVTIPRDSFQQVYQIATTNKVFLDSQVSNLSAENVTAAVLAYRKVIC